jgi:CheY-like chemotaxis protein
MPPQSARGIPQITPFRSESIALARVRPVFSDVTDARSFPVCQAKPDMLMSGVCRTQSGAKREHRMPMTLLLVNDDLDELFFWRRAIHLRLPAAELVGVNSAADALEFLTRVRVSAIVTDNRMPLVTGIEMVGLIRRTDQAVPIIMITGLANAETAARLAGVTAFISVEKLDDAAAEIARLVTK